MYTFNKMWGVVTPEEAQAKIESDALLQKCYRMGVLSFDGTLNDILTLNEEAILKRRLQTIVFEKGMASTVGQARQLIVHGHIFMNGHKVTVPGYVVSKAEESSIMYNPASPFNDETHPMRLSPEQFMALQAEKKAAAAAAAAAAPAEEAPAENAAPTEGGEQ